MLYNQSGKEDDLEWRVNRIDDSYFQISVSNNTDIIYDTVKCDYSLMFGMDMLDEQKINNRLDEMINRLKG